MSNTREKHVHACRQDRLHVTDVFVVRVRRWSCGFLWSFPARTFLSKWNRVQSRLADAPSSSLLWFDKFSFKPMNKTTPKSIEGYFCRQAANKGDSNMATAALAKDCQKECAHFWNLWSICIQVITSHCFRAICWILWGWDHEIYIPWPIVFIIATFFCATSEAIGFMGPQWPVRPGASPGTLTRPLEDVMMLARSWQPLEGFFPCLGPWCLGFSFIYLPSQFPLQNSFRGIGKSVQRMLSARQVCFDPADNMYLVDNEDSQIVYLDP